MDFDIIKPIAEEIVESLYSKEDKLKGILAKYDSCDVALAMSWVKHCAEEIRNGTIR